MTFHADEYEPPTVENVERINTLHGDDITATCPHCEHRSRCPVEWWERVRDHDDGQCKNCGNALTVPPAP